MTRNTRQSSRDEVNKHAVEILQEIQNKQKYKRTHPTEVVKEPIDDNSLFAKFIRRLNMSAEAVVSAKGILLSLTDPSAQGSNIGGLIVAILNFLFIPLIYLYAFLTKKEVPFTLSNNLRWLFAALFLGLVITAFVVTGAAPIIGLVVAGIGFILGCIAMVNLVREYHSLTSVYRSTSRNLHRAYDEMSLIKEEAILLSAELTQFSSIDDENKEQGLADLYIKIAQLDEEFSAQKEEIQQLKEQRLGLEEKLADMQIRQILKRSLLLSIGAISLIGSILVFILPTIGAGILSAVAIIGLTYLVVRLAIPFIEYLTEQLKADNFKKDSSDVNEKNTATKVEQPAHVHESTADVLKGLNRNKTVSTEDVIQLVNVSTKPSILMSKGKSKSSRKDESDAANESNTFHK